MEVEGQKRGEIIVQITSRPVPRLPVGLPIAIPLISIYFGIVRKYPPVKICMHAREEIGSVGF
jgi:hypothetical protein